jgi:hypothetical protein
LAPVQGRLPSFVIIGTAKGGTTSLFGYLVSHPEVFLPPEKEIHFFDEHYDNGTGWYREQFAAAGDRQVVGEATPQYMYHPHVPARMAALVPDAKLVAILRNPAERAYSHYWFQRSKYTSRHSFEEAIAFEFEHPGEPMPLPHDHYLGYGRYLEQLKRVCEAYPREALHVMLMDDLRADVRSAYASLCRFLSINPAVESPDVGAVFRATSRLRSERLRRVMMRRRAWKIAPRLAALIDRLNRIPGYPPMATATRDWLVAYFAPFNEDLGAWLGRDLSAWNR